VSTTTTPRLKAKYNDEVRDQLKADLELGNVMEVPRLEKIVVNVGAGAAVDNKGLLEKVVTDLTVIAGQKPVITKAKKSIAGLQAP
jgi:large subunit ribosomal protein L5